MGQLLVPALIGAGVGAVGGAVSGQNPFKTALLGAGLGAGGAGLMGAGGATAGSATTAGTMGVDAGAGLIGGANLTGAGIASGAGATGATSGLGSFLSSIHGVETAPVSFGTGGYASGITSGLSPAVGLEGQSLEQALGYTIPKQNLADITSAENIAKSGFPKFDESGFNNLTTGTNVGAPYSAEALTNNPLMSQQIANNAGQTVSPSFFDRFSDMIGNPFTDLTSRDKLGLGLQGVSMLNQPQQMIQPSQGQISKPNFDPSSTLVNVSPNVKPTAGAKTGLIDMMASIPLTDEEKMRLQQLSYRG